MEQEQVAGRSKATNGVNQASPGKPEGRTTASPGKPKRDPVMQSEKAINYLRVYIQKGMERYGIHYATPIEELVDRFSRQTFSVKQFLEMVRYEESEREFGEILKVTESSPGRRRVTLEEVAGCPYSLRPCRYPAMAKDAGESLKCPYSSEMCPYSRDNKE